MPTAKSTYYTTQLYQSLCSGHWNSQSNTALAPKAQNGTSLSWYELLRKGRKHCTEPHERELVDVAQYTQSLSVLISGKGKADANEDAIHPTHPLSVHAAKAGLILKEEQKQEARESLNALLKSSKSNEGKPTDRINLLASFYCFALSDFSSCIYHLETVDFSSQCQSSSSADIPPSPSIHPSTFSATTNHSRLHLPHGGHFHSTVSLVDMKVSPQIKNGYLWEMTERVRGVYLQGLSHELSETGSATIAHQTYSSIIPLISSIPLPSNTPSKDLFPSTRELHKWVQRLFTRIILLSSQHENVGKTLNLCRAHQSYGNQWGWGDQLTFRDRNRCFISEIHLRSLIALSMSSSHFVADLEEVTSLVVQHRALLETSTRFPTAEERNSRVEHFVELVVGVWDSCFGNGKGGVREEDVGWVIDTLWWAASYTFNSPQIYRSLSRLLSLTNTHDLKTTKELSRRALATYVEVVSKARQSGDTMNPERESVWVRELISGGLRLARFAAETCVINGRVGDEGNREMAIKDLRTGLGYLVTAREILETEGSQLKFQEDNEGEERWNILMGKLQLAEGVSFAVLAKCEENRSTREKNYDISRNRLEDACSSAQAAPEAKYHLALSLARPSIGTSSKTVTSPTPLTPGSTSIESQASNLALVQDLPRAITLITSVVESQPYNVRAWHLLGLLLAANDEWEKGEKILEWGLRVGETNLDEFKHSRRKPETEVWKDEKHDIQSKDFASVAVGVDVSNVHGSLFSTVTTKLPGLYALLPPPSLSLPLTPKEAFFQALQVRLSQLALIEKCYGAERAGTGWVACFDWVRSAKIIVEGGESESKEEEEEDEEDEDERNGNAEGSVADRQRTEEEAYPPSPTTGDDEHSTAPYNGSELRRQTTRASATNPVSRESTLQAKPASPPVMPFAFKITPATPMDELERQEHEHSMEVERPPARDSLDNSSRQSLEMPPETGSDADGSRSSLPEARIPRMTSSSFSALTSSSRRNQPKRQFSKDSDTKQNKRVEKVQQLFKSQVHKGAEGFKTVSRNLKIGRGGRGRGRGIGRLGRGNGSGRLQRSNSAPDFHAVLAQTHPYQASSIHSRPRTMHSWGHAISGIHRSTAHEERARNLPTSPTPTPSPPTTLPSPLRPTSSSLALRSQWEREVLSDLWCRAAATFRREGKMDECRSACQEAEVLWKGNVGIWVQYGLYLASSSDPSGAQESFNKALFIDPDNVPAAIHLSNQLISSPAAKPDDVDMAVGLLTNATLYRGWDVPEAWFLLAKCCKLQNRLEKEREFLGIALRLVQGRGLRHLEEALGVCL